MKFDDVYMDLLDVGMEFNVDISSSRESQDFFSRIVETFNGSKEELLEYARNNMSIWFRTVEKLPEWIQNPEWQFLDRKPMVFVGQINVPYSRGWFHDEASFYIFWAPDTGETRSVIQVS